MRTPEQVWDSMEIQMDRGVGQNFAHRQIEATLVLAEQTKRIADLLDQVVGNSTDKKSGKKLRSLTIADLSRGTIEYG